jgi:protein-L-isoaspartate(D-aspartate) O-methyltransferase
VVARGTTIRRERMVAQLREQGIRHPEVLKAMAAVPREQFVEEALRGKAYTDAALPIGEKQTISQPWIVARMAELLEPDGAGRVLEIGTGSGYHAAVLAQLFELVYTVERIRSLSQRARQNLRSLQIENVHFKIFDGSYGWSEFAPFQAVLVTAAVPEVPAPLVEQLSDGGRLVLPLGTVDNGGEQMLTRVVKQGGRLTQDQHGPCRFVPLVGKFGLNP